MKSSATNIMRALTFLYICSIIRLLAEGAIANYSFTLHTHNLYTNHSTQQDLKQKIADSFILTISKSFNIHHRHFDTYMRVNEAISASTKYTIAITEPIKMIDFDAQIKLSFIAYVPIPNWHFDEYIIYDFLHRSLSHTLNTTSNDSMRIILKNISCFQLQDYERCPINETRTNDWQVVTQELFDDIYTFLRWIFLGIIAVTSLFVIAGYIHSWIVWNADIVIGNAVFFVFTTFDWYSDILFTFSIPVKYLWLWLISFCLLLIPLIGNVAWLVSQQKIWEQDAAIGARAKAWFIRWRPFLYSMTIISGSAFGSLTLCNSNMWGYPLFRMGLRNIHLERFDSKRLLITVLGENVPQIILQGLYWFFWNQNFFDRDFSENRVILTLAMISGIISILYAFGIIYSSRATLSRFNDNEEELFEINIISSTDWPSKDKRKNRSYKYKLYPLRKELASLLQLDIAYVELHPPVKIEYGYQLRFTLMVKDMGGNQVALQALKDLIEYKELGEKIMDVWKLETLPRIEQLRWKKDRKRDYQENMVLLQHSSVPVKKESDVSMSNHSFSPKVSSGSKKHSYFEAPPAVGLNLPEVKSDYSHSNHQQAAAAVTSPQSQHQSQSQHQQQLRGWNPMPSYSSVNAPIHSSPQQISQTMHNQTAMFTVKSGASNRSNVDRDRDALYRMITAPQKVVTAKDDDSKDNEMELRRQRTPPPPPLSEMREMNINNINNKNILNVNEGQKGRQYSIGSIGSVNSEAAFQQQLFNHIRMKNNMITKNNSLG